MTLDQALNHPKWADRQEDYHRFRHHDEQGSGSHRGSLALRRAGVQNRCARASGEYRSFHGGICGHFGYRSDGTSGYADSDQFGFGIPEAAEVFRDTLDFFTEGANLHFEKPRMDVFRCLSLAYQAIEDGRSYPIALNGANEELVAMFLNKEIRFLDIQRTIEKVLKAIRWIRRAYRKFWRLTGTCGGWQGNWHKVSSLPKPSPESEERK